MNVIKIVSTVALSLVFGIAAPTYAQREQQNEKQDHHEQQQSKHDQAKPEQQHAQQERAQPQRQGQSEPQQQAHQPQQADRGWQQSQHAQQRQRSDRNQQPQRAQQQQRQDQNQPQQHARQQQSNRHPDRAQGRERVQQSAWQEHRSQHWGSDHRTWQQRGGYNGYRIPEDRFRGYFGRDHGFRIHGRPFLVVGGFPRFQYNGYWVSLVDPWPGSWANNWYDTDDVYVTYVNSGYYLFNRRHPDVGIAISISL